MTKVLVEDHDVGDKTMYNFLSQALLQYNSRESIFDAGILLTGCYAVYTSDLPWANRTQLHGLDPIGRCVEDCPNSTIYGLSVITPLSYLSFSVLIVNVCTRA